MLNSQEKNIKLKFFIKRALYSTFSCVIYKYLLPLREKNNIIHYLVWRLNMRFVKQFSHTSFTYMIYEQKISV